MTKWKWKLLNGVIGEFSNYSYESYRGKIGVEFFYNRELGKTVFRRFALNLDK